MSQSITTAQVKAIAGTGAKSDLVAAIVNGWLAAVHKAGPATRNRACHFLAQIMTEADRKDRTAASGKGRKAEIRMR
jgi:predicted chitinase